ncbi:TPA: hypothetical protein OT855_004882, partial [Serratia liquefaciens]|nr:hypothetical protein [Serratia liquefaciens]
MPLFAALAEKLNITTLSELGDFSLEQVLAAAGDDVSLADCHALHAEAVRRLALSTTRERQAVTHANPQLLQAPHLGISAPAHAVAYGDNGIPDRNDHFVKEGDVSSMFSPAAYLTEMYHNAEQLHDKGKTYHLDTRRPDLSALTLSQENLDTPLSTLSLSNEILQATLKKQSQYTTDEKLHAALAENQSNPEGPYHHAFTGISEALRAREASPLTLLAPENRPAGHDDMAALCLALGISPALYAQLTTDITFENAKAEYKKVFGDTPPETLLSAGALAAHYNLPEAMFVEALARSVLNAPDTGGKYVDNAMSGSLTIGGDTYFTRVFRTFVGFWAKRRESLTLRHRASGEHEFTYISSDSNQPEELRYLHVNNITVWQGKGEVLSGGITQSLGKTRPGARTLEFNRVNSVVLNNEERAKTRGITLITECHSSYSWLLTLHHQVLLHRSLGLSLPLIARLQARHDDDTASVLRTAASLLRFQRDYALDEETAGTLAGLHLDVIPTGACASQYDRVFNAPPLDGFYMSYGADEQLEAHYNPLRQEDLIYFQRIYRALGLSSQQEFQMLNRLALNFNYLSNSQEWLSHLYRGKLLADIHGLTVSELSTLLPLLNVTKPLSDENFASVVDNVWTATCWLRAQNLSVAGLQALLTNLNPVQTPEITALVLSLRNDVVLPVDESGKPVLTFTNLVSALAPHMASALGLTSPDMTHLVIRWLDQLGYKATGFWNEITSMSVTGGDVTVPPASLKYCLVLGKLAAIVKGLDLSERELELAVGYPDKLAGLGVVTRRIDSLMLLSRLHGWVNALGEQASAALTALQKGTLTVKLLAELMSLDGEALAVAAKQSGLDKLSDFITVERLLQWHQAAQTLNVSAATVGELFAMRFVAAAGKPVSTQAQWQTLSGSVLAGLSGRERAAVSAVQDERLSSALSQLYMGYVAPAALNLRTRDDLYGYLLIDSQVSADVTTTRIAEAMASLQLYVNRCMQLGHLEKGVKTGTLSRPFFREWATYNRRYSTWAGVSQLAYYPENYVDPTQRAGETTMMRTLQQSLNQGQLTQDQVEGAFKHYLSEFEKVA